ncbi:hypothetical protein [Serratia symbiotica]|uniref:MFS transporter n=2 Tax=Serratia symbiotica TaxID=138074 RepID=A0A7D5SSU2_9GAMM|nr:hypothetical protein [Serratia symbiotica]MBF1995122.1 hypothetical protein [Serratia symbiotica]QLH62820.1 MFS transporter [Serratia symbiotica]QTP15488.1 hypothetical protein GPZ83_0006245 [Serratia symbiotica]
MNSEYSRSSSDSHTSGFYVAVWTLMVPFDKIHIGIGNTSLGLLLCIGVGSMLGMPPTGKWDCRSVVLRASPALIGFIQSGGSFTCIVTLLLAVTDSNRAVIR